MSITPLHPNGWLCVVQLCNLLALDGHETCWRSFSCLSSSSLASHASSFNRSLSSSTPLTSSLHEIWRSIALHHIGNNKDRAFYDQCFLIEQTLSLQQLGNNLSNVNRCVFPFNVINVPTIYSCVANVSLGASPNFMWTFGLAMIAPLCLPPSP